MALDLPACIAQLGRIFLETWVRIPVSTFLPSKVLCTCYWKVETPFKKLDFFMNVIVYPSSRYHKDTEPLHHSVMYSLVSLLSSNYPLPAMHSLLVTLYVTEYLIPEEGRQQKNSLDNEPWGFPVVTLGSTKLPVMVCK